MLIFCIQKQEVYEDSYRYVSINESVCDGFFWFSGCWSEKKLQVECSQSFRLMKTTWRFFAPYFLFDSTKIDIYDPPVESQ